MIVLRALARVLLAAGSVRDHRFWRLVYSALASRVVVAGARLTLRAARALRGEATAAFLLSRFGELFVSSGWPHQQRGWVNLDASRFTARIGADQRFARKRAPRREPRPLRLGCVGQFAGLLSFAPEHFAAAPSDVELHVFDVPVGGRAASFLDGVAASYTQVSESDSRGLAAAVDRADLDALLVVLRGRAAYELVARAAVPCVMFVCTGSDLLHHDAVDVQLFAQPQADYFLRGEQMFCATTRAPFSSRCVDEAFLVYDSRGLDPSARRPWAAREPRIVVHGSLYKAASAPFLDVLCSVLRGDADLELVVMGKDDGESLERIQAHAKGAGVGGRVRYEGAFSPVRGADGRVDDPGWRGLVGELERARLAPDPWPMCGATSRVEAFGLGAPSPHLAVRYDEASWGRRQDAYVEVPALDVPSATARTPAEYARLCRRLLADGDFADRVAAEQAEVFARVTDGAAYWAQVVRCYDDWRRRSGAAARLDGAS